MGRTMSTQSGEIDRSMSAVGKSTFIRTQRYDDTNQKDLDRNMDAFDWKIEADQYYIKITVQKRK